MFQMTEFIVYLPFSIEIRGCETRNPIQKYGGTKFRTYSIVYSDYIT